MHNRKRYCTPDHRAADEIMRTLDALTPYGEQEPDLPYYVELAGEYSIGHATADNWHADEDSDPQFEDDGEHGLPQEQAMPRFWLSSM